MLTFNILDSPSHGVRHGSLPKLSYTPNANHNGVDTFTFEFQDDTLTRDTATVSITIHAVNDSPSIKSIAQTTASDDSTLQLRR